MMHRFVTRRQGQFCLLLRQQRLPPLVVECHTMPEISRCRYSLRMNFACVHADDERPGSRDEDVGQWFLPIPGTRQLIRRDDTVPVAAVIYL